MELFYSNNISSGGTSLDAEESNHCVRVLRHRRGDEINVIDGSGNLYRCRIVDDNPKGLAYEILECIEGYGSHPYHLHMAVCPPKNIDRFEWFCEKATEIGVDEITPLFGDYSERKVFKPERVSRILVSAAKQSHKGAIPELHDALKASDFIRSCAGEDALKLICYCDEAPGKQDIHRLLAQQPKSRPIVIMIGPEGDFSRSEVDLALSHGWLPASLGESRLRIETAALVAVAAVYIDAI